jgi:hypothetical protein
MRTVHTLLGLFIGLSSAAALTLSACDWDTYDPRIADGVGAAGGAGGVGGVGGVGGGVGGSAGAGGSAEAMCNGIELMPDEDFEDGLQDPLWTVTNGSGGTTTETGGQLVVGVGTLSYSVAGYISRYFHDFRDGDASVEVVSLPPDPEPVILFQLERPGSNRIYFHKNGGNLSARKEAGGVDAILKTVPYDPTEHRFWRIRNQGDEVLWETSATGDKDVATEWTTIAKHSLAGLFDLDWMRPRLYMDSDAAPMGATAIFDNMDFRGAGRDSYCRVETLADGFDEDERSDKWLFSVGNGGATARQFGGQQVLTHAAATTTSYYNFDTSHLLDMLDGAVSVELAQAVNPGRAYLRVLGEGTRMELLLIDGMLELQYDEGMGGQTVGMPTMYEPTAHRWLRLRNDAGTAYWEVSADGMTWNDLGLLSPTPVDFSEPVQVRFGSSTPDGNPDLPPVVLFDNFNITPSG